jgi:hypothetical protein
VDKVIQKFRSIHDAELADRDYYRSLSPQQRLDLLLELLASARSDETEYGFARFIALLKSTGVRYLLVGGHAVAFHGYPRFTGDIDFFVEVSPDNAARLEQVLQAFGFGGVGIGLEDFLEPGNVIQLGRPPNRIDLLTSIDGVLFQEAWPNRVQASLDGLPVCILSKPDLLRNKQASNRPQDRADLDRLG